MLILGNLRSFLIQKLNADSDIPTLKEIIFAFNHESIDWIVKWEELGGLKLLVKLVDRNIKRTLKKGEEDELNEFRTLILNAFDKYTRTKVGLNRFIKTENALNTLLLCMSIPNISEDTMLLVFKLLTVPCMIPPDGHR